MKLNNISIFKNEFKTSDAQPDYQAYGSLAESVNGKVEYSDKSKIGGAWKKKFTNSKGEETNFISISLTQKEYNGTKKDGTTFTDKAYVLCTLDEYNEYLSLKASNTANEVKSTGYTGEVADTSSIDF